MEAGQLGVSGISVAMESATKNLPSNDPLEPHPYSGTPKRPLSRPPLVQLAVVKAKSALGWLLADKVRLPTTFSHTARAIKPGRKDLKSRISNR